MLESIHFLGDNAINKPEEDLFNFKHYAEKVQKLIQLNSSNPEPITIGIYGKWGEGKTSFLNLVDNRIEHFDKKVGDKEYLKWHFNPWRYSNEDEMMFAFFDGLSKNFYANENTNLQEVGNWISKYSKYLKAIKISATVGIPKFLNTKVTFDVDKVFEALGADLKKEKITLEILKDKVNLAIKKANFKVIVFIDDLDRLDKEEIYTVLKLIKLNANFDNFIFVVNLDIDHVSKAIKDRYGDNEEDGKMFLEKIINIPIHLPKIEDADLKEFFRIKLYQVKTNLGLNNNEEINEVFKEIVMEFSSNLFSSPREIIRVLNSFFLGAFAIGDEVNLRDLFWIEYLKIKNGDCYNFIKSCQFKSIFNESEKNIEFNDEYDSEEKPNGSRKYILEEFKNVNIIINALFPQYSNHFSILGEKPNLDLLDKKSRINSLGHFEKYFSFHNIRKTSVIKLNSIDQLISKSDSEGLISLFKDLFLDERQHYKILYRIEVIIKGLESKDERNFFYSFLFNNLDIIPDSKIDMYGVDYRLRLIELTASTLDKDQNNENSEISLSLAKELDIYQLCHFTRKFKDDKPFKKSFENLISEKANRTFNIENPVYKNPLNASNKMIMHYWKLGDKINYSKHIELTIINEENIQLLIRNFPTFWNNSYFGALEQVNYEYMAKLVDVDFIYKKIMEFNPVLVDSIDFGTYEFSDSIESTIEENLKQFIFWHQKDDENRKHLLLLNQ